MTTRVAISNSPKRCSRLNRGVEASRSAMMKDKSRISPFVRPVERLRAHPQLPLERLCTHRSERSQLNFAREACEALPARADLAYETACQGLILYAETESALNRPIALLNDVYGDQLHLAPVLIRYRDGDEREEPHMGVRILCAAQHFTAIRNDLAARRAQLLDAELRPPIGVLRATAPLAALMGYSAWLAQLTGDSARDVMWFSHYAPCETPHERVPS
jgi:elongation factor G-like protein